MNHVLHKFWLLGEVAATTVNQLKSEGWLLTARWESGAEFHRVESARIDEPDVLDGRCVKVFKIFKEGAGCGEGSMDVTYLSVRENNLTASNFHILDGGDAEGESNGS